MFAANFYSMNIGDHIHGTNVYFYNIGFAGSNGISPQNWIMRTLSTLVRQFNDTSVGVSLLKILIMVLAAKPMHQQLRSQGPTFSGWMKFNVSRMACVHVLLCFGCDALKWTPLDACYLHVKPMSRLQLPLS